jgi:hypothetical protein
MKKLLLSFAVVLSIASIFAFASIDPVRPVVKNAKLFPCTYQFIFTGTTTQVSTPSKYVATPNFNGCPGFDNVCGLCFNRADLVYPTVPATPKVDQAILIAAINAALTQPTPKVNPFPYTIPGTSDVIQVWLKP